jgi:hypothetical protein
MKGCFGNSSGFGDSAKHSFVHETIKEYKFDFFALETGRGNFSAPFLRHLLSGLDFIWYCLPPQGRSGGILVGINASTLQVNNVVQGNHCVNLNLKNKANGFEWALILVYGAAQEEHIHHFLAELAKIYEDETLPMIVGGDFNILRRKEDKNNKKINTHWPFVFNAIIENLDLRELALSGRQFTWANRRPIPMYEKLDRVLGSVEWEQKFHLVTVRDLTRAGSDHTPLLLDSGVQAHLGNKANFSFELSWLRQEGFKEMVIKEWRSIHMEIVLWRSGKIKLDI